MSEEKKKPEKWMKYELEIANEAKYINKPNTFINALYQGGVLADKLLNQIFYEPARAVKAKSGLEYTWTTAEIQHYFGMSSKNGSFYTHLQEAASDLTKIQLGYNDKVKKEFGFYNIFTTARFKDGKFTIIINGEIEPERLFDLKSSGYTPLALNTQKYKGQYTNKFYQLLKQYCYGNRGLKFEDGVLYRIRLSIYELRFKLGLVDMSDASVKRIFNKKNKNTDSKDDKSDREDNINNDGLVVDSEVGEDGLSEDKDELFSGTGPTEADYEAAYKVYKGKKIHDRMDSFKNRVIRSAIEEMEAYPCDILVKQVEYIYSGKKATHVEFVVMKNSGVVIKKDDTGTDSYSDGKYSEDSNGQLEFGNDFEISAKGTKADEQIAKLFPMFAKFIEFSDKDRAWKVKWLKGEILGILKAANFNEEFVMDKLRLLEQQTDITDKVKWVAWAVRQDFNGTTTREQRESEVVVPADNTEDISDEDYRESDSKEEPKEENFEASQVDSGDKSGDDWDFEILPNGMVKYQGMEFSYEIARESCPLSKKMIKRLKTKYNLKSTAIDYMDPIEVVRHLGGDPIDYMSGSYPEGVNDFINNIYMKSKRQAELIEYAVGVAKEKGYVFTGKNEATDRAFIAFVNSTINNALDWAFTNM